MQKWLLCCCLLGCFADTEWVRWGNDLENTRWASTETLISPDNIARLEVKWTHTALVSVSMTPTVIGNNVYLTDWGGSVTNLDLETGDVRWTFPLSTYTLMPADRSRTSPLIFEDMIIVGSNTYSFVVAINRFTGALIWRTRLNLLICNMLTMSLIEANGIVFAGTSHNDRGPAVCPLSRGSVVALDIRTGEILWTWWTFPDKYQVSSEPLETVTGASVWGRSFSFDLERNLIFVPTGNVFNLPKEIMECERRRVPHGPTCLPDDIHTDSVIALNMTSGEIVWSERFIDYENWNIACDFDDPPEPIPKECPDVEGPDYDFGQGLIVLDLEINGTMTPALGAGQKSGYFWLLNRETGEVIWSTRVCAGGTAGGLEFGSAYDGERFYVGSANSEYKGWRLRSRRSTFINGSHWAALDPKTGDILWETVAPVQGPGAQSRAALTVANGVVFTGQMDPDGTMVALDAKTGKILWQYQCGAPVAGGPSVVNGIVLWGCGYKRVAENNMLAFHIPQKP